MHYKIYENSDFLLKDQYTWVITGIAGFIGSHLMQSLLELNQIVVGIDNFYAGHQKNLDDVLELVDPSLHKNFTFIEGDIRDIDICRQATQNADYILHHAAVSSVPKSIQIPELTNSVNVDGFLNMLMAAKEAKIKRFVYASSSAVYGDSPILPKVETHQVSPLSPYAASKASNELYANAFSNCYGIGTIGLRYFNVFGARQDPCGDYAAVIPHWITAMLNNDTVCIYGDGETTRDFCHIANVVQANLLAALTPNKEAINQVYNIAEGSQTSLNFLFQLLKEILEIPDNFRPMHSDFREGDIKYSLADISKAKTLLEYKPIYTITDGLKEAMAWYKARLIS